MSAATNYELNDAATVGPWLATALWADHGKREAMLKDAAGQKSASRKRCAIEVIPFEVSPKPVYEQLSNSQRSESTVLEHKGVSRYHPLSQRPTSRCLRFGHNLHRQVLQSVRNAGLLISVGSRR